MVKPTKPDDYYTTGDLAQMIGVTLRCVAFAVDAGRLPAPDVSLARGDRLWLGSSLAAMARHPEYLRMQARAARKAVKKGAAK